MRFRVDPASNEAMVFRLWGALSAYITHFGLCLVVRTMHTSTTVTAGVGSLGHTQARPRGSGIRAISTSPS